MGRQPAEGNESENDLAETGSGYQSVFRADEESLAIPNPNGSGHSTIMRKKDYGHKEINPQKKKKGS